MQTILAAYGNRIAESGVNGVCQGILLTVVTWGFLKLMPRINAATRFAIWWPTLIWVALLPFVSFKQTATMSSGNKSVEEAKPAPVGSAGGVTGETLLRLSNPVSTRTRQLVHVENDATRTRPAMGLVGVAKLRWSEALNALSSLRHVIFIPVRSSLWSEVLSACWFVGSAVFLSRILWGFVCLGRLKKEAIPDSPKHQAAFRRCAEALRVRRGGALAVSDRVSAPVLVGLGNPVIVMPAGFAGNLSDTEFEQVLLHELAHLKRWDDWTNLGEQLLAAVLFFHPAVWWIGRRLRSNREIACDDWVLAVRAEAKPYAICLTRLAELTLWPENPRLATGVWFSRAQLSERIALLLDARRNSSTRILKLRLAAMAAVVGLAIVAVVRLTPAVALAAEATPGRQGVSSSALVGNADGQDVRVGQRQLLEQEIKLIEERLKTIPEGDAKFQLRLDLLERKRELLALAPDSAPSNQLPTDTEERELRRLQAIARDSPDLINSLNNGEAPLHQAALQDQLRVASYLLAHGANVDLQDNAGRTPLACAAGAGYRSMVELLLAKGANVNAQNARGQTALHQAAQNGYKLVTETLIAHGASVNAWDAQGQTPLFGAVRYPEVVALLLSHGAEVNAEVVPTFVVGVGNALLGGSSTPLHAAACFNSPVSVKLLMDKGAHVDAKDNYGQTPLCGAVRNQSLEVAKLLLENHADPNVKFGSGGFVETRRGKLSLLQITPLYLASAQWDKGMVELLLDHGANVNERIDDDSQTALFPALDQVWLAELLIKHGANVNAPIVEGKTPLVLAVHSRNEQVVKLLLANKADINSTDILGQTALFDAVAVRDKTLVELLLNHGANVNVKDKSGLMPLGMLPSQSGGGVGTAIPLNYLQAYPGNLGQSQPAPDGEIIELLQKHGARTTPPASSNK